jgi:hypothetical protein
VRATRLLDPQFPQSNTNVAPERGIGFSSPAIGTSRIQRLQDGIDRALHIGSLRFVPRFNLIEARVAMIAQEPYHVIAFLLSPEWLVARITTNLRYCGRAIFFHNVNNEAGIPLRSQPVPWDSSPAAGKSPL